MTRKCFKALGLALFFLVAATGANGQTRKADQSTVVVPEDVYPLVVVSQPTCPLKIEKVVLLRYLDGGFGKRYQLRNVGPRPINEYTIVIWNSDNTGDVISWRASEDNRPLVPDQGVPSINVESLKTVPLTDELRTKLELNAPMKKVVFFFVLQTKDSDGTEYNARTLFDGLKEHLKKFQMEYEGAAY